MERWKAIVHAYGKLPPFLRSEASWYMNEATVRDLMKRADMQWPEDEPLLNDITLMGLPIVLTQTTEVLLAIKVCE